MHLHSEILEQVILKLYLARVQIVVQEYVPEVTSMQCIGPTPDILA
jgi:hypothetical protein